jgi:putative tricarboxylic transport membrane protein
MGFPLSLSRKEQEIKENNRYTAVFWAVLGLYIAFEGYRLQLGTLQGPKSGFLIFWAGIFLSGLSLILFIQTFFMKDEAKKAIWNGLRWQNGLKLVAALTVYTLFFKWAGFLLCTLVLLLFLLKSLASTRWSAAIVISVATTVACYIIFGVFLDSRFPEGMLEIMLNRLLSYVMA